MHVEHKVKTKRQAVTKVDPPVVYAESSTPVFLYKQQIQCTITLVECCLNNEGEVQGRGRGMQEGRNSPFCVSKQLKLKVHLFIYWENDNINANAHISHLYTCIIIYIYLFKII